GGLLEFAGDAHQLAEVLDAALILRVLALVELTQVPGLIEDRLEDFAGCAVDGHCAQVGQQVEEVANRVPRPGVDAGRSVRPVERSRERDALVLRERLHAALRAVADATTPP